MIAIIPARGGSKGLPGKNVKKLNGTPLIAYTVKAALNSKCISRVILSTDSTDIADIGKEYGAEVPFIRPPELASDTASAVDVYVHAAEYIKSHYDPHLEKIIVLLPTVPLRNEMHIDEAYNKFYGSDCDTLVSVREAPVPPEWYLTVNSSGYINPCGFGVMRGIIRNRQDSKKYYIPNGAIYILDYDVLMRKKTYYTEKTAYYVMDERESIDIDTLSDFEYAEYLIKQK